MDEPIVSLELKIEENLVENGETQPSALETNISEVKQEQLTKLDETNKILVENTLKEENHPLLDEIKPSSEKPILEGW